MSAIETRTPGLNAYQAACASGDTHGVEAFLRHTPTAAHDVRGFMLAVTGGHADVVRRILFKPHHGLLRLPLGEAEAEDIPGDTEIGIDAMQTALQTAVTCGHCGVVRALLSADIMFDAAHALHAFLMACENRWSDMVDALLPFVHGRTWLWSGDVVRTAMCNGYMDAAVSVLNDVVKTRDSTRYCTAPVYTAVMWLVWPPNGETWPHDMYAAALRCVGQECESDAAHIAMKWLSICTTDAERAVVARTIDETCSNPCRVRTGEACFAYEPVTTLPATDQPRCRRSNCCGSRT